MSANRQIAKNLIYNIAIFVVNTGISFILSPYLIKTVGKEAYSFYPLVNNIISYANILTTAIGSMAGRYMTMELYKGRDKDASSYFNSVLLSNWFLSLFLSVILLISVFYLPYILTIPIYLVTEVKLLFVLSAFAMIITFNSDLLGIGTYVKNRIDLNSSRRLILAVVNVVVIFISFLFFQPTIVYIGLASFTCSIINIFLNFQLKRRLLPEIEVKPIRLFSLKKTMDLLSSGLWNSVNQLSNVLLTHIDLLITNIFLGAAATGDFALVKMAPNLIYTLLALLSGSFIPNFNILYAKGKFGELLHEIKKSMRIIGAMICIPIGFLLIFADDFFYLWVPSVDSEYLYWLSFITVLPMIFGSSINPVFGVFTITNKLKIPSLVLLLAGILNTLFIYVLLKTTSLGIWSIPLVSAVQQTIRNFFFTPIYASVCLKEKKGLFYPTVIRCCLALLVVCVVGFVVKSLFSHISWFILIIEGSLLALFSLAINAFVVLNKKDRIFIYSKVSKMIAR